MELNYYLLNHMTLCDSPALVPLQPRHPAGHVLTKHT